MSCAVKSKLPRLGMIEGKPSLMSQLEEYARKPRAQRSDGLVDYTAQIWDSKCAQPAATRSWSRVEVARWASGFAIEGKKVPSSACELNPCLSSVVTSRSCCVLAPDRVGFRLVWRVVGARAVFSVSQLAGHSIQLSFRTSTLV